MSPSPYSPSIPSTDSTVLRTIPYESPSPRALKRLRLDSVAHADPALAEHYQTLPQAPWPTEGTFPVQKPDPSNDSRTPDVLASTPCVLRAEMHTPTRIETYARAETDASGRSPSSGSEPEPEPEPLVAAAVETSSDAGQSGGSVPPAPVPAASPPLQLLTSEAAAGDPALQHLLCSGQQQQQQHPSARALLEAESHRIRTEVKARAQGQTATATKYNAHIASYERWWASYQVELMAQGKIREPIPPQPITAAKVTLFLDHEMTREKRKAGSKETIPGSCLGRSHIAGVISALEGQRRSDAHRYENDPDAQRPLRQDDRIRTLERNSRQKEPARVDTANALKASGTSSDAYTPEDLHRCSLWCLSQCRTGEQTARSVRDRAMLLLSAGTAFRGDNARMIQWSDLFLSEVPLPELGADFKLPVLGIYSDNAKHNQQGRVDESGVVRHRLVELCPVGAVAFLFWAHFHVQSAAVPAFAPDFSDRGFGQYGRRDWYSHHLFWAKDINQQMSYDTHYDRIKKIHIDNDISVTKVTHATRHYGAQNTRSHGASVEGTKAMGGWCDRTGSFRPCYDRAFHLDALLGAAMFNGRDPSSYSVARQSLAPPQDLVQNLFPWIEREQRALAERAASSRLANDIALQHFLRLLTWFRTVLLQDAAILYSRNDTLEIFKYAPFNTARFQEYADNATEIVAQAEMEALCAFEDLPERMSKTMRGLLAQQSIAHKREITESRRQNQVLVQVVERLQATVEMSHGTRRQPSRKRKKDATDGADERAPPPPYGAMLAYASPLGTGPVTSGTGAAPTALPPSPPYALAASISTPAFFSPVSAPSTALLGTMPMMPGPVPATAMPWLPSNPLVPQGPDPHAKKRDAMRTKYGDVRVAKHPWALIGSELTPSYLMQPCQTITDIWTEYTDGLNDFLPVRELEEHWGPKWRGNVPKVKTAWGRRKKVVDLVVALSKKPRWDVDLALRFLEAVYGEKYTAGTFCAYLQKTDARGHETVMERSNSYP